MRKERAWGGKEAGEGESVSGRALEGNQSQVLTSEPGWVGKQVSAGWEVWEAGCVLEARMLGEHVRRGARPLLLSGPLCAGESPWKGRGGVGTSEGWARAKSGPTPDSLLGSVWPPRGEPKSPKAGAHSIP